MRNILEQLAPHLLSVACYDREVNCRRAAAAAFQENVGRQGNYPHGIDIVNNADYFSLSSRVNSYLHIAVSIAQYEGYLYPFVEELMFNKICHWDKVVRELAAEALSALVKYEPEYFANFVVEKLIPCTLSTDLCMRHGATLAVGEVVLALRQCEYALSAGFMVVLSGPLFCWIGLAHTPTFCAGVLDSLAIELKGSKDFSKLYAGIAILGYIASISESINSRAISHLVTFLGHRYPKIRKASAEQVYLVLLQNASLVPEDKIEKSLEIIAETCWEGDVETTKPQRLELYDLVGLDPGLFNTTNKVSSKDSKRRPVTDENASYSSLVGSSGF
ncbi:hypothetical protein Q3G72_019941 [Acer saccharum]|nr:hypothetical protein Q3G72_019941 [Acer saccharum]